MLVNLFLVTAYVAPLTPHLAAAPRAPQPVASAKILPFASVGVGGALLFRASAASGANAAVLASLGGLSVLNLAVTDNARYASTKRALAAYRGRGLPLGAALAQRAAAHRWKRCVTVQLVGQFAGLVWAARAASAAGVLRGAAAFMGAQVAFFALGAAESKHDAAGLPAPMKSETRSFVLVTDAVLFGAALLASLSCAGSAARTVGSGVFAAGALIGAAEGVPKTVAALKGLAAGPEPAS